MSDIFSSQDEHVVALLEEFASIRAVIKEVSTGLSRIEKRVRKTFPVVAEEYDAKNKAKKKKRDAQQVYSEAQAFDFFDKLKVSVAASDPASVDSLLDSLSSQNLRVVAEQLGLTANKRAGREQLLKKLVARAHESISLSRNIMVNPEK